MRLILLAFLVLLVACKNTQADSDVGLYDPLPPAGSAFVRFLNLSSDGLKPAFQNKKYKTVKSQLVSPYYVFEKGNKTFQLNDQKAEIDLEEWEFYTVITPDLVIRDEANVNRTKATIAFYNLSDNAALTLKAKEGSVLVLEDVEQGAMKAREMNAVKIDFGVYRDDVLLKVAEPKIIERGNHYSLIYTGDDLLFFTAETNTRL